MNVNDDPHRRQADDHGPRIGESLAMLGRLSATAVGLMLLVASAYLAVLLASTLIHTVTDYSYAREVIDAWAEVVGPDAFRLKSEAANVDLNGSRVVAITAPAGLILLSSWLLVSLVRAGAEVVSISTSDKKAIERILRSALGRKVA